jgi:hypothetical protein
LLEQIILVNFRKEIRPFIPKREDQGPEEEPDDDCSDILMVSESTAIAAHNEDANAALVGHTYVPIPSASPLIQCTSVPGRTDRGLCISATS